MLEVRTQTDGGQTAEAVADRVVAWLAAARETLDLALYDVRLPGAVGDAAAFMDRNLSAGLFHASASLGIAEAAVATATAGLAKRGEPGARARMLIAENVIQLGACRATIARGASLIDEHYAAHPHPHGD